MPDENKLTIGLGLPFESLAETVTEAIMKARETQSPFIRDGVDLWGFEILMNVRAAWLAIPGNKWIPLPELEAHIAQKKEAKI